MIVAKGETIRILTNDFSSIEIERNPMKDSTDENTAEWEDL